MDEKITWLMVNEPYNKEGKLYVDCEAYIIVDVNYISTKKTVTLTSPLEYVDPAGLDITDTIESTLSANELTEVRNTLNELKAATA